MDYEFSEAEREQVSAHGLREDLVLKQLDQFAKGAPYQHLLRPCTVGDGIYKLSEADKDACIAAFEGARFEGRVMKFVPASGAASRMFKELFAALADFQEQGTSHNEGFRTFAENLQQFAFVDQLRHVMAADGKDLDVLVDVGDWAPVLRYLLTHDGLNYGEMAKGLLLFHRFGHHARTPMEEHLREALVYAADEHGHTRVHFTVSPEHMDAFVAAAADLTERLRAVGFKLDVDFSVQKPRTDTVAATIDNTPFHDESGQLLFRPGGHGALIDNLDDLKGDIVFIKNIDNVVPDPLKEITLPYKKMLGGFLLKIQTQVFAYLHHLDQGQLTAAKRDEMLSYIAKYLGIQPEPSLGDVDPSEAIEPLHALLNRPIRVCGMVVNQGEPGGGPFWVRGSHLDSIQIVEGAQIDKNDPQQRAILNDSTHFNPVDLVCGVRNYRGEPFSLKMFVDHDAYFIAEKSRQGHVLKALERPGLWNGGMAFWNTIFVEVPLITFNPVKTVNDLLRSEHQGH